jgi:hypothetical protein
MVMHVHTRNRVAAGLICVLTILAAGCGAPPTPLTGLNASYESALKRTASLAATIEPGSETERRAFGNLQRYFDAMTPASVRELTAGVYAPTGYLNDTLVGISGARRIEAYFGETAAKTRRLEVKFLDRAPVGIDWFVRWRMTVAVDGVNDGAPVITYGVTQLRFDEEGRVLLHKDFWDSGTGLYEQLPVLGTMVGWVRAAIEPDGDQPEP